MVRDSKKLRLYTTAWVVYKKSLIQLTICVDTASKTFLQTVIYKV